jgi:hypothetical protein
MKQSVRKWLKALRSGEFKQGKGYLASVDHRGSESYCCLGVACELFRRENPEVIDRKRVDGAVAGNCTNIAEIIQFNGENLYLPKEVRDWLGLKNRLGADGSGRVNLSYLNDEGLSFEGIATTIENTPELFVEEAK